MLSSVSSVVSSLSSSSSASPKPPLGAAIVATVKALSVIVGVQPSGRLIELIWIVSPTLRPSRSIVIFSGIEIAGQLSSTCALTIFKTPPSFNPGHLSSFKNSTLIPTATVAFLVTLKKSTCSASSETGCCWISRGKTKCFSLLTSSVCFFKRLTSYKI